MQALHNMPTCKYGELGQLVWRVQLSDHKIVELERWDLLCAPESDCFDEVSDGFVELSKDLRNVLEDGIDSMVGTVAFCDRRSSFSHDVGYCACCNIIRHLPVLVHAFSGMQRCISDASSDMHSYFYLKVI